MAADALEISLFALIQKHFGTELALLHCTKSTLVHVSHTIEDLVLSRRIPAILFTGFQESSHWREETERYRALATVAQQVCIFAGGSLPPESTANELHITLRGDDPLRQEWFLTVLSAEFAVVLCGKDRAVAGVEEPMRQFETLWSFEPTVVNHVLDLLESVIATYRPERLEALQAARRQYPPSAPNPVILTQLTSEMIRFEEDLHQRLYASTQALQKILEWREDLMLTLVHDLRTPLSVIKGSFDLLAFEGGLPDSDRRALITGGLRGVARLGDLVAMILDTNRLESGHFPVDMHAVEAQSLAETLQQLFAPLGAARKLAITASAHPAVGQFWADSALLIRVIENLVYNSTKFTADGGKITCLIQPAPHDEFVEIQVRDTGIGIPTDHLAMVFDRLYQGSKRDRRGLGLGLYFCKLAIEAQGGSITPISQVGIGTTMVIRLPRRPRMLPSL